jgi:hypothetical protein
MLLLAEVAIGPGAIYEDHLKEFIAHASSVTLIVTMGWEALTSFHAATPPR